MDTKFEKNQNCLCITVTGRLDTVNSGDFQKRIDSQMDDNTSEVEIDCSGLEYISSSGLRVLMTLYKKTAPKGGRVTLRNLTAQVGEVLNITGMSSLFNIE